jgi:hypothetical protein
MIRHRVTSIPSGLFIALLLSAAACSSPPQQLAMAPGPEAVGEATNSPAAPQGVLPAPYVGADQSVSGFVRQGGG